MTPALRYALELEAHCTGCGVNLAFCNKIPDDPACHFSCCDRENHVLTMQAVERALQKQETS